MGTERPSGEKALKPYTPPALTALGLLTIPKRVHFDLIATATATAN